MVKFENVEVFNIQKENMNFLFEKSSYGRLFDRKCSIFVQSQQGVIFYRNDSSRPIGTFKIKTVGSGKITADLTFLDHIKEIESFQKDNLIDFCVSGRINSVEENKIKSIIVDSVSMELKNEF